MKYDFTSIMDRHNKDSIAIDSIGTPDGFTPGGPKEGFDVIPMWVADMNFPTVPTIPEAIIQRVQHPAYGYFSPTEEYYDSIIRWHRQRNHVTNLTKEEIGYENGVLGCVISALTAFAAPGDNVLLHSPTYIGFTNRIQNNGYHIIYNPYLRDRVRAKSSKPHYNDMNVLSMHALIGAYKAEGHEWVDELLKAGWDIGVAWQDGRMFHGKCAIRMNLALPLSRVKEAFSRLHQHIFI